MNKSTISESLKQIITVCSNKKATDIRLYHVEKESLISDYIIVLSIKNKVHCQALVQELSKAIKIIALNEPDVFFIPPHISGKAESEWVVFDINTVVIHIVSEELRSYYSLDELFEKRAIVYHY